MDSFAWRAQPFSWDLAQRLADELAIPLLLGIVLARRGFSSVEQARSFLEVDPQVPDPFLLEGMLPAVQRLAKAAAGPPERVVIHGDYDVDGVSATALLVHGLRPFGIEAEPYLPSRFEHGYGLSRSGLEDIAAGGPGLVITVDCGIAYPDEVTYARGLGLEMIVTDHHEPGERLPDCPVVHAGLGAYPHRHLSGVGVALKLLHGLYVEHHDAPRDRLPDALLSHLDLVALGTVADLVPLLGENRYYVKEGLVRLAHTEKAGLRALMSVSRVEPPLDTGALSFRLAPRLNAAGRLEDPQKPLRLMLTDDEAEGRRLAEELEGLNQRRREVEARILAEAVAQVELLQALPPALVLIGEDWHQGVIGIVASRLVERYHRPTLLLSPQDGVARGSGRSIPAFDLVAGLRACAHLLEQHGGHRQAAGLTVRLDRLDEFRAMFVAHAASELTEADFVPLFAPDAVARGSDLNLETADAFARLAPFGMGNPRIHLLVVGAKVAEAAATRTGEHLRCTLEVDGMRCRGIGFRLAENLPALQEDPRCHAGVLLQVNEWQGASRAEVELHSLFRPHDLGQAALGCSPDCPFLDDLEAAPPCSRCADPFGSESRALTLPGRDLRDRGEALSHVAQVLGSGESAAVLTSSVPHRLAQLTQALPLLELGVAGVDCVSRNCWRSRVDGLRPEALLFADWAAAERRAELLADRRHLLVLDPPYRPGHIALLAQLSERGVRAHLLYGPVEREFTAALLALLLHPRPWMVALYRAWRQGLAATEATAAVARDMFADHRVLASADELQRAQAILAELGLCPGAAGGGRINTEASAAYTTAVATYEEAVTLCRTL
jgi:single-stranded-DNA-specific exonuclease